jgi:hypothetical protein
MRKIECANGSANARPVPEEALETFRDLPHKALALSASLSCRVRDLSDNDARASAVLLPPAGPFY